MGVNEAKHDRYILQGESNMLPFRKRETKNFKNQPLKHKRNEKNTRALRRQQKECWGGGLHSGSSYYSLQNFLKKSDNLVQKAF